jgi:Spy/CpxP family protein refolding chaperone
MTKTTIAVYLALIFFAGAVAGGAVARKYAAEAPRHRPPPGHHSPEEMRERIFNMLKTRLNLTGEQVRQIEPVFQAGFREVCAIQEKSLAEVEEAVRRNHEEIAKFLTPEQREEMRRMDQEHREKFRRRSGPPGPPPKSKEESTVP